MLFLLLSSYRETYARPIFSACLHFCDVDDLWRSFHSMVLAFPKLLVHQIGKGQKWFGTSSFFECPKMHGGGSVAGSD